MVQNVWARKQTGFTIVELLIVIVVIAILAAITIVAYNGIQEQARVSRAQSDVRSFVQAAEAARINTGKPLKDITGSGNSSTTQARADNAIDTIAAASGVNITGLKAGDPWGNYYQLDENELEMSSTDCRQDVIRVQNKPALTVYLPSSQPQCL